jgi:predicted dienelactone hydrolase
MKRTWLALVLAACAAGDEGLPGQTDAAPRVDAAAPIDAAPPADAAGPVGPFAVGVTTRTWIDKTRPTPPNGSAPGKAERTLVTEIWYPAVGDAAQTTAVRDAAAAPGRHPLVLFVHGSGSSRLTYSYLTVGLARAGFAVAAASFPLTDMFQPGGSSDYHVTDQVGDLAFLADQAAELGHIDASRYAVVGHSTGGAVASLAAYAGDDPFVTHDPRVAAIVPIAGDACMFDPEFFSRRSVPVLIVAGTNDLFVRLENGGAYQLEHSAEPRLLAKLVGGQHVAFTDFGIPDAVLNPQPTGPDAPLAIALGFYGDSAICLPEPPAGTDPAMSVDTQHALTVQLVAAFVDAELRGHRAPLDTLLAAPPSGLVFEP